MSAMCPHCQAPSLETDRFCHSCGARLATGETQQRDASLTPNVGTEGIHPLPVATGRISSRAKRRNRSTRRPWYRRRLVMVLAACVALILVGTATGMVYINHQFAQINDISTPPPKISGGVFDPAATAEVDTGPAQQVLALAESGATGDFTLEGGNVTTMPSLDSALPDTTLATPSSTEDQPAGEDGSTATTNPNTGPTQFRLNPVENSDDGSLNILLMGVDARPGEAIDSGVRPDSLSVLHLDATTGSCRILAIPRDTRTELPGYGQTKINHALAIGGIPFEKLVVEQLLGIKIDHYGLIDFSGIQGLVDAVGGVTVNNPRAFEAQGISFAEGEITLNGEEALAYARFRYDERGDFGRIDRQQQVIRALISQTSGMDVATGAYKLLGAAEGHIKTDMSVTNLIGLAKDYRSTCTEATLEVDSLDGSVKTLLDPLLNMDLSFVIVDPAEIDMKVEWLLGRD